MREDKVIFLKNPNKVLEQLIKNFILENDQNRRTQLDLGAYVEEPLVGFASGMDPLFFEYKTVIGSFHLTPREIISAALKEKGEGFYFPRSNRSALSHGSSPFLKTPAKVTVERGNFHPNSGSTPKNLGRPVIMHCVDTSQAF